MRILHFSVQSLRGAGGVGVGRKVSGSLLWFQGPAGSSGVGTRWESSLSCLVWYGSAGENQPRDGEHKPWRTGHVTWFARACASQREPEVRNNQHRKWIFYMFKHRAAFFIDRCSFQTVQWDYLWYTEVWTTTYFVKTLQNWDKIHVHRPLHRDRGLYVVFTLAGLKKKIYFINFSFICDFVSTFVKQF